MLKYSSLTFPLQRLKRRYRQLMRKPSPEFFSEIGIIHGILTRSRNAGKVMIDVGAQYGESFFPFRLYGWRILTFEPDPDPRKQSALKALTDKYVTVARVALSDRKSESASFYTSEESTGISSLSAFRDTHRLSAEVQVSTLDHEIAKYEVSRVDFLKIDTEGHDFFVLRGFPWNRAQVRPRVILCEFEDRKTKPLGYVWTEVADFLVAHSYIVFVSEWFPITNYGSVHRWRAISRYPAPLLDGSAWGNLAAFADGDEAQRFELLAKAHLAK